MPLRLRDGGHFSGRQCQDSLRVPVEANAFYFAVFALGVYQHDSTQCASSQTALRMGFLPLYDIQFGLSGSIMQQSCHPAHRRRCQAAQLSRAPRPLGPKTPLAATGGTAAGAILAA